MFSDFRLFVFALPFISGALCATYAQTDSYQGSGFLQAFSHEAVSDPTHGRVNYVDAQTAASENLTYASGDHFVLRADYRKTLDPNGPGRDSVRMQSYTQYGVNTVVVFSIRHMPQGCGTWPAIWTVGADWPNQGEIDILEGVNDQGPNTATLRTSAGCTMPASRSQTGTSTGNNCDVLTNVGCGVKLSDSSRSYGQAFNSAGGGWYAIERTDSGIKVWFWSRSANNVPGDVSGGATTISTDKWGTPSAYFPSTSCDMSDHIGAHNIIINLTFCGDWAGNVYGSSGCPSSCVDYVNNNPSAFRDAYFDFQWVKAYATL